MRFKNVPPYKVGDIIQYNYREYEVQECRYWNYRQHWLLNVINRRTGCLVRSVLASVFDDCEVKREI